MSNPNVFMIPDNVAGGHGGNSGIDPNLLLALNQNGGFGANGNWMWLLFLWLLFPAFGGGWGNGFGGFGGFGGANGAGYLGNIPKGRKRTGFKELVWYKDELQKCVERLKH